MYDEQHLAHLEGEARAAAFYLGRTLAPVRARLDAEAAAFDPRTANPADLQRRQELTVLLGSMQAYCEAAGALNTQLSTNLTASQEVAHAEASRAAMFLQQIRLMHDDLKREQALQLQQLETFQHLLRRAA